LTDSWASGWTVGDVMPAVEFKRGIGALADTTLGGAAANIDLTSISGSYAHLLIVAYLRTDLAGLTGSLGLQFNGDTTASYDYQQLLGSGSGATSFEQFAQTSARAGSMPAASAIANSFGVSMVFIPHYAGSANNKVALSLGASKVGVTTGSMFVGGWGGFWRSSAAISRITLLSQAGGNLVAGSRVTLYGLGA
jgi:hypothetical protein